MANEGKPTRSTGAEAIEVEGIKFAPPLTRNQAQTLVSYGLPADSADSLMAEWLDVESMWAETVEEARSEPGRFGFSRRSTASGRSSTRSAIS